MTATEYYFRLIVGVLWIVSVHIMDYVLEHRWALGAMAFCVLILFLMWIGSDFSSNNHDFEGRP